jgi:hypothetical protein
MFDLDECIRLYQAGKITEVKPGQYTRDWKACPDYINEYFYLVTTGDYLMKEDNKYKVYPRTVLTELYFNRVPKNIYEWFYKQKGYN